jgi:hypothetical protein
MPTACVDVGVGVRHGEGRSITAAAMRPANVAATIAAVAHRELVTIQAGMATDNAAPAPMTGCERRSAPPGMCCFMGSEGCIPCSFRKGMDAGGGDIESDRQGRLGGLSVSSGND